MAWRKSLVRAVVFGFLAAIAGGAWLYHHLTNPDAVRLLVIARLEAQFNDAHVQLESAQLRILGGIEFKELRITRDGDEAEVLHVPAGVIYHDKESLLDGRLALRKIELDRPTLTLCRTSAGHWNIDGLLTPADLSRPMPTMVLRDGTVRVDDRLTAGGLAPLELTDLHLSILNDPLLTLRFEGRAASEVLGPVRFQATAQRGADDLDLTVDLDAVPLGPGLGARLAAYEADLGPHLHGIAGTAVVHAEAARHPSSAQPTWGYDVHGQLHQVRIEHPLLPLVLEGLEADLRCTNDRLRIDKLTAHSGPTELELTGALKAFSRDADLEGELKVRNLQVTPELFDKLPPNLQDIKDDYQPAGPIDYEIRFARQGGRWQRRQRIVLDGASAAFCKFPYRVDGLQGLIEQTVDEAQGVKKLHLDLVGASGGGRPLHLRGDVIGEGERPSVTVDIWGDQVPLDARLREALGPRFGHIADSFHPTGQGDFVAHIRRSLGEAEFQNEFRIQFHDATVRYDVFPYPFEGVSGTLEIHPAGWEFHDFHGTHNGCTFRARGRSEPQSAGDRLVVHIEGTALRLDRELEAAVPPKLRDTWASLAPSGRMDLTAEVEQAPGMNDEVEVSVACKGGTIQPRFFPYPLDEVAGRIHYHQGRVDLEGLSARHGASAFTLGTGLVVQKGPGGFWLKMSDLAVNPLIPDAAFLQALPPSLREPTAALRLDGPVALRTEIVVDSPSVPGNPVVVYWDGGMRLDGAHLHAGIDLEGIKGEVWCRGRHNGRDLEGVMGNVLLEQASIYKQPFTAIHSHIEVTPEMPEVLRLPDLKARLFGGDLGGEVRMEFGPTLHYEMNLTALGVQLEEFARQNLGSNALMSGQAAARLHLKGTGTDFQGLEGGGSVDVPAGRIYNLPFLLDLLKVLGLRPPDRTAFEEAHAVFTIHGPRMGISRLDLDGNAISLGGQGEMDLDGSNLMLDFYAVWGRIKQVLPPVFRELPPAISQQLLKIKVRGRIDQPQFTKEAVPVLVEPLARLLRRRSQAEGPTAERPARSP